MTAFILLAITLFISLLYIEAIIGDSINKRDRALSFRIICIFILPILWSLFFYLIHIQ
jgi:hypothetical protein